MDNDLIFGTETSDMLSGSAADDTQLAAVPSLTVPDDDALRRPFDAAQVVIPEGEAIVRIPVAPGEVVELPFPADAQFLARIDNGNLAIRVGDVTVILQGYVEAAGETPPVIQAANGQPIDIATILAATDPAIDIETAAGPAAGPQGQGADNTGAFFQLFGPGAGLGGFLGVGALDATEGPGAGIVEPDGIEFREPGLVTELAAALVPNVAPIFKSGVISVVNRPEDAPDVHQILSWTIIDPDSAGHTLTVDPATLPAGVTFNPVTNRLDLDTKGHYDYLAEGQKETFTLKFTIHDGDGNSVGQDFTLEMVGKNDAPVAVADTIITNVGKNGSFVVPEWALLANDKDVDSKNLDIVPGMTNLSGIALTVHNPGVGSNGTVTVTDNATLDGSFKYKATDGVADSKAVTVTVDNHAGGDLTGTGKHEILIGSIGKETLHGGGGNDIVIGNGGGDELFGDGGDDTLVFAAGSKIHGGTDNVVLVDGLEGGAGMHGDVLAFSDLKLDFSDKASVTNMDGIETISMAANVGGAGAQSLTIGAASVEQLSDHTITPGGVFPEREAVRIDGDAVDQLYLSISKDGGNWTNTGVVENGYQIYAHETTAGDPTSADAYVMVHTSVVANVHLNADAP
jgi:hypothetical protein